MTVEVCLTPELIGQFDLSGKNVVVIDIFRATSCMVTGLCNDVRRIYPVATVGECLALGQQGMIMAGERGGQKIEAFDIGNSPFDYLSPQVSGKDVAVTTTNGTHALKKSQNAHQILIGAFLNLSATTDYILHEGVDIVLHCAGWKGTVNLEDTLYAGALIERLGSAIVMKDDASMLALSLYNQHKTDLLDIAKNSGHAQRLAGFGITKDIEFCMTTDEFAEVVVMNEDHLILQKS